MTWVVVACAAAAASAEAAGIVDAAVGGGSPTRRCDPSHKKTSEYLPCDLTR